LDPTIDYHVLASLDLSPPEALSFQINGDFLFRPAKPAVNHLFRRAKNLSHLPVAHFIVKSQKYYLSKMLRQLMQGFVQDCLLIVDLTIALAVRTILNRFSLPLNFPQHVFGHVSADCCNPRAKPLRLVQPGKLPACSGKRFLGGVFGRMMIQQNRISHGHQRGVIPPAQLAEALRVGLQSSLNENLVIKVFHLSNIILNRAALYFHK
jgi:hypothetical protein